MISRLTRFQLVAFVVIAAVMVTYGAIAYLNVPRLLGIGRHAVSVELPDGAGLYPNGIVTLRGVTIGQVDDVALTDTGAVAHIQISDDYDIPEDSLVEVRSTSAVGEQYINFEPRKQAGPFVADDTVIPAAAVTLPDPIGGVLAKVDNLVQSVPADKLNTTVDELYAALNGAGPDIRRLIDSAGGLTESAEQALPETLGLIDDAEGVLETQTRTGDDLQSAVRNLADFTTQLQESDPALRGTLDKAPPFLDEVSGLFDDLRPTLPGLLTDLTSVGQVTRVYIPHLAQTLTILPSTINNPAGAVASSRVPGTTRIDFDLVVNDPPSCTTGFIQERRAPTDYSYAPPGKDVYCKVAQDNPQAVRGARNAPCPEGSPDAARAANARDCGWDFQSKEEDDAAAAEAIEFQKQIYATNPRSVVESGRVPPGRTNTDPETAGRPQALSQAPYDLATGVFLAPGAGGPMIFGDALPAGPKDWQGIFLDPLGVTT
ncbi:MlaD family protein [Pseudonocardia xishanensis]|uniref:Phospholipid/cholesterol/gamma-HCH transport system substrate-binding protein n=1 Tax=Pseudonocardia xishanensis TaxID=630995 RepID=A0ABP8RSC4_9PSEU